MKKLRKIIIPFLVLLPFFLYISIIIINNIIAYKVGKELRTYTLPTQTVLVDSMSAAGKLIGSGNGMQYMGAILVTSDLSEKEILEHYKKAFEYIEVKKQDSPTIDTIRPNHCYFNKFDYESAHTYYSVIYWGSKSDYANDFLSKLLDFDLRGH